MVEKVRAVLIVEIMGRPAEHVKEMLKEHVEKIDEMKDVSTVSISLSEPKELEQQKGLFTCFAEVEVEAESFLEVIHLVFDYMPSSLEIIRPDKIDFGVADATSFLNDLSGRLHKYDEIAKIAKMQNQQLAQKVIEMGGGDKGGFKSVNEEKKVKVKKKVKKKSKS